MGAAIVRNERSGNFGQIGPPGSSGIQVVKDNKELLCFDPHEDTIFTLSIPETILQKSTQAALTKLVEITAKVRYIINIHHK